MRSRRLFPPLSAAEGKEGDASPPGVLLGRAQNGLLWSGIVWHMPLPQITLRSKPANLAFKLGMWSKQAISERVPYVGLIQEMSTKIMLWGQFSAEAGAVLGWSGAKIRAGFSNLCWQKN